MTVMRPRSVQILVSILTVQACRSWARLPELPGLLGLLGLPGLQGWLGLPGWVAGVTRLGLLGLAGWPGMPQFGRSVNPISTEGGGGGPIFFGSVHKWFLELINFVLFLLLSKSFWPI